MGSGKRHYRSVVTSRSEDYYPAYPAADYIPRAAEYHRSVEYPYRPRDYSPEYTPGYSPEYHPAREYGPENYHRARDYAPEYPQEYPSEVRRENQRDRPREGEQSHRQDQRPSTPSSRGSSGSRSGRRHRRIPPVGRPWNYKCDEKCREERKKFEKENPGFDWTDGVALALMGAATWFSVDKMIDARKGKDGDKE